MKVAIDIRRIHDYGIGTYIRNLVNKLAELDRANAFLLIGSPADLAELNPLPANFQLLHEARPERAARSRLYLPFLLRQQRVDLLHIPHLAAPQLLPCRCVFTAHDAIDFIQPPPGPRIVERLRVALYRRALHRAARIIAVSQATKRDIERIFGLPEHKVEVVYNALDERFSVNHQPADWQKILERYQVSYPYVLYAGNVKPQKNIPRLIEAFVVLKEELRRHPDYQALKLIIIGDELSKHPQLRRTVIKSRSQNDVRFMGFLPHEILRVFYQRAAVFVFPSLHEGFGLPPLEAMANGTPVVASNCSALPEVVGHAALAVNPENVFDISRGMREVLLNRTLREQLIRAGYEQVQRFSWQRSVARVREIYHEAVM